MRGTRRIPATSSEASPAAKQEGEDLDDVAGRHRRDSALRRRRLRADAPWETIPCVLLVVFAPAGFPQVMFFLTLAIAMYLTVIELRDFEPPPAWRWWAWWLSLVFLTHFVGYLILRGYAVYRRRTRARA